MGLWVEMSDEIRDALAVLARSMQQRGNVTQSDINTLFSPELAYLTGTYYTDPSVSAQEQDNLMRQYAPNLRLVLNLPDTDIRKIIANEIVNFGSAPWDVKRQIEEYTAKQAELNPGVYNQEGETSDLMRFADTVFSESNNLQVQGQKQGADEWAKVTGGLPRPEMDFTPEQIAPELFQKLSEESKRLRAEVARTSMSDKTKQSALKFLEEQKNEAAKRATDAAGQRVPHPSTVKGENILQSLNRNLANTPMGRGEAGVRGLIPQLKYLEQIPAGLMGLYRGVTDPLEAALINEAKWIGQETIGVSSIPKISLGDDPVGQFLYGKVRPGHGQTAGDGSDVRAENVRFGRIAQDIVNRANDPTRQAAAKEAQRREKFLGDITQILGVLAQQKARSVGYTPYREALTARQNFLRGGGG